MINTKEQLIHIYIRIEIIWHVSTNIMPTFRGVPNKKQTNKHAILPEQPSALFNLVIEPILSFLKEGV